MDRGDPFPRKIKKRLIGQRQALSLREIIQKRQQVLAFIFKM